MEGLAPFTDEGANIKNVVKAACTTKSNVSLVFDTRQAPKEW